MHLGHAKKNFQLTPCSSWCCLYRHNQIFIN